MRILLLLLCACAAPPPEPAPNPWPLNGTTFRLGSGRAPVGFRAVDHTFRNALRDERLLKEHRNLFWGANRDLQWLEIRREW